jgi:hypothetical protein
LTFSQNSSWKVHFLYSCSPTWAASLRYRRKGELCGGGDGRFVIAPLEGGEMDEEFGHVFHGIDERECVLGSEFRECVLRSFVRTSALPSIPLRPSVSVPFVGR